jgi:UDP-glucose:(heptosyl)LPS alpha-1,3-glucosyltransferase
MRIGLLRRGYSPSGGAEAYLKRLAAGLRASGHEPVLFTTRDWPLADWNGERVVLDGRSPRTFVGAFEEVRDRARCGRFFSMERVPACDVYRAGDGVHKCWLARRGQFAPWWKRCSFGMNPKHQELLALEKQVFDDRATGRVIANAEFVKKEIAATYGYPENRIDVIRNGLPADWLESHTSKAEARAEFSLPASALVVLFVGSGWERKGLQFALRGFRKANVAGRVLVVAGKGRPMRAGDNVRFLGPVTSDQLRSLYAAADIFLLPTIYDPFSNATLEALASGLPVITSPANGVSEIMRPDIDGTILSAPDAVEEIAGAIERWADPVRRGDGADRRTAAKVWTMERNVAETLAALEKIA